MRERGCASGRADHVPPAIPEGRRALSGTTTPLKDHKSYRADKTGTTGLLDPYRGCGTILDLIVGDEMVSEKRKSGLLSRLIDLSEIKLVYVMIMDTSCFWCPSNLFNIEMTTEIDRCSLRNIQI